MRVFIFVILISISSGASAQIAAKFLYIQPTGEQGQVLKPLFTIEPMYLQEFDDRRRGRIELAIANFKTRMDTFPVYAVQNGSIVLPGWQTFSEYKAYFLSVGMDFNVLNKKSVFLYPGFDLVAGGIDKAYKTNIETYKGEDYSGGIFLVGFKFRLGTEYMFNDYVGAFFEVTRSYYLTNEGEGYSHNDFGLGAHYIF